VYLLVVACVLQKQSKAQKRREKKAAEDAEREARIAAGRDMLGCG
jgi:hypothetical protein